jgi:hypothetical protein
MQKKAAIAAILFLAGIGLLGIFAGRCSSRGLSEQEQEGQLLHSSVKTD